MRHDLFPTLIDRWRIAPWWVREQRIAMQHSLLRLLAVASAERLNLGELVDRLADDHRGSYRRKLRRLSGRLLTGTPLVEALEQTPGVLADEEVLAIRLGTQSGTLTATYLRLLARHDGASLERRDRVRRMVAYFCGMCAVGLLISIFLLIRIFPSYNAILHGYGVPSPIEFNLVVALGDIVQSYWYVLLLLALATAWVIWSAPSQQFFRRTINSRLVRPVAQLRAANVLDVLAIALNAGRPLPGVLSTLARYHYDSLIRHRLLYVRNEVEQGAELWQSMHQAQLISAGEARALEAAPSTDAEVWTLRQLSEVKERRVTSWTDTVLDLMHPLSILVLAGCVLLLALASFMPLIQIFDYAEVMSK